MQIDYEKMVAADRIPACSLLQGRELDERRNKNWKLKNVKPLYLVEQKLNKNEKKRKAKKRKRKPSERNWD